jgi:hypothetical protein
MNLESRMREKADLHNTFGNKGYNCIPLQDALTIAREYAEELKAENEKLSLLLNENTTKWHTAELKLQKARHDERARIMLSLATITDSDRLDWLEEVFKKDEFINLDLQGDTLRNAVDKAMNENNFTLNNEEK